MSVCVFCVFVFACLCVCLLGVTFYWRQIGTFSQRHVTCYTWHVTSDMRHMTYDTWHLKNDMWPMTCDKHIVTCIVNCFSVFVLKEKYDKSRCKIPASETLQFPNYSKGIFVLFLIAIFFVHFWSKKNMVWFSLQKLTQRLVN